MCLIVTVPRSVTFPQDDLLSAYYTNPHGVGVMWVENNRVRVKKNPQPQTFDDILATLTDVGDRQHVIHLRFATSGTKTRDNTHPFCVLNKETHGRDLYMVHNGVLSFVDRPKKSLSDTAYFVSDYLRPMLSLNPNLIYRKEFQEMLERIISSGNKLTFLDSHGKIITINEKAGTKRGGCWVSNTYSLNNTKGVRHTSAYQDPYYDEWSKRNPLPTTTTNYGNLYNHNTQQQQQPEVKKISDLKTSDIDGVLAVLLYIKHQRDEDRKKIDIPAIRNAKQLSLFRSIYIPGGEGKKSSIQYILTTQGESFLTSESSPPQETDEPAKGEGESKALVPYNVFATPIDERLAYAKTGKIAFQFCDRDFDQYDDDEEHSAFLVNCVAKEPEAACEYIMDLLVRLDEIETFHTPEEE